MLLVWLSVVPAPAQTTTNQGPLVSTPDGTGSDALIDAASSGNADLVKSLIGKGANINSQDKLGSTPLLHACWDNRTEAAEALLDAGADPNLGSNWKQTPLMYAAEHGNAVLVQALIDHKADVNANCDQGTPLLFATVSSKSSTQDKIQTIQILLTHGADPSLTVVAKPRPHWYEYTAFGVAARHNLPDVLDAFLAQKLPVDAPATVPDGASALMLAAGDGSQDAVADLLKHGANPNFKSQTGETPLMWAGNFGHLSIMDLLITAGADINATDAQGETALTHAANFCRPDVVQYLKDKGATRTDVHILPGVRPTMPLTPGEEWGLAIAAPYIQRNRLEHHILGGLETSSRNDVKKVLVRDWGVHSEVDILSRLNSLIQTGQRARFLSEGRQLADMDDASFQSLLATKTADPTEQAKMEALRKSYQKWGERDAVAWDLCRYVYLVEQGYSAGYLQESEAWPLIHDAAVLLQKTFSSWQEVGDNFLDAREIWSGSRDPQFELALQLLKNPQDPNSPWTQAAWNTSLSQ
jgi:ankyrin repeat protein